MPAVARVEAKRSRTKQARPGPLRKAAANVSPAVARVKLKQSRAKRARGQRARKAATNLSLRVDLVERAKALGLNLSEFVDGLLEKAIHEAEQARWLAENREALEHCNAVIKKWGLFGEEFRQF